MTKIFNEIIFYTFFMFCISAYAEPIHTQAEPTRLKHEKYQAAIQRLESSEFENRAFCGGKVRSMSEVEYGTCVGRIMEFCAPKCSALESNESEGCLNECIANLLPEDFSNIKGFKERARISYAKAFE